MRRSLYSVLVYCNILRFKLSSSAFGTWALPTSTGFVLVFDFDLLLIAPSVHRLRLLSLVCFSSFNYFVLFLESDPQVVISLWISGPIFLFTTRQVIIECEKTISIGLSSDLRNVVISYLINPRGSGILTHLQSQIHECQY